MADFRERTRRCFSLTAGTRCAACDVSATLDQALALAGLDQATVVHRPRLLSDNGPSYVSAELAM